MSITSLITAMQKAGISPDKIIETIKIAEQENEEKLALRKEKDRLRKRTEREKSLNINDRVQRNPECPADVVDSVDNPPLNGFNGFPHPSLTSLNTPPKINPKGFTKGTPKTELPDWMPIEAWEEFKQMRMKIKKPMTPRAEQLAIGKLEKFRAKGHDPTEILNQSILNDYQDIYEIKQNNGNYGKQSQNTPGKGQLARAAADKALAELEESGFFGQAGA